MAKPIEDNDNAKEFWEHLSDATALEEATKTALRGLLGAEPQVKSASFTAINGQSYHIVSTATVTDPTPVEGKGFSVFVRNGTATVGGTDYATAGTIILRTFHSGSWANRVYQDKAAADAAYATPDIAGALSAAAPSNGEAAGIVITGTLTDDARAVEFPKLYQAPSGKWTWDGLEPRARNYEPVIFYDDDRLALEAQFSRIFTITIATPGVVTSAFHGLANGMRIKFSTNGALPTGVTAGTTYYVVNKTNDTFQFSATSGGAGIATSGSQSGTHVFTATLGRWQAAVAAEGSPELADWSDSAVSPSTGTPSLTLASAVAKTAFTTRPILDPAGFVWQARGTSPDHVWEKVYRTDEMYHDFNLDSEGTEYANGATLQSGATWLLQTTGSPPKVDESGRLGEAVPGSATASTWYGGSLLRENVYQFGCELEWVTTNSADTGNLSNYQIATILIMGDGFFSLNKLIHLIVRNYTISVDFATRGGVAGFRSIILAPSGTMLPYISTDTKTRIQGRISGDVLELTVNGLTYKLKDSRIAQLNAKTILFEQVGNEPIRVRYHRVWANAPIMDDLQYQPRSVRLEQLSTGLLRQPLQIPVGSRSSNSFGRPLVAQARASLVDPVNSNGTTNQTLWSYSSIGMPALRSRWQVKAFGRIAANGNDKLLAFTSYLAEVTTGTIAPNGGFFELDCVVYRSTATAYTLVGNIRVTDGAGVTTNYSARGGGGWPSAIPFTHTIKATTTATSDVILDLAYVDYVE